MTDFCQQEQNETKNSQPSEKTAGNLGEESDGLELDTETSKREEEVPTETSKTENAQPSEDLADLVSKDEAKNTIEEPENQQHLMENKIHLDTKEDVYIKPEQIEVKADVSQQEQNETKNSQPSEKTAGNLGEESDGLELDTETSKREEVKADVSQQEQNETKNSPREDTVVNLGDESDGLELDAETSKREVEDKSEKKFEKKYESSVDSKVGSLTMNSINIIASLMFYYFNKLGHVAFRNYNCIRYNLGY